MKKYWFHKHEKDDQGSFKFESSNFKQPEQTSSRISANKTEQSKLHREHNDEEEKLLKKITKHSKQLGHACKKWMQMEHYYQKTMNNDFNVMEIKCFRHDDEIILYCKDHCVLVCAKCVYGDSSQSDNTGVKIQGSNQKSTSKSKFNKLQTHEKHHLRQLCDAVKDIDQDNSRWNFQLKADLNNLSDILKKWNRNKQEYQKIKNKIFSDLQSRYDQLYAQLSNRYMAVREKIKNILQPYEESINIICGSYQQIKKNTSVRKFPLPLLTHVWFQQVREKLKNMPAPFEVDHKFLNKSLSNELQQVFKKFHI